MKQGLSILFFFLAVMAQAKPGDKVDFFGRILDRETKEPIPFATIRSIETNGIAISLSNGSFHLQYDAGSGTQVEVSHIAYKTDTFYLKGQTGNRIDLFMEPSTSILGEVTVVEEQEIVNISHLPSVEGVELHAARKNEVILPQNQTVNLGMNQSREIFGKVAGLTFWESDQAGLQLGIGGRGLSPDRTAYYNVRQNGYDIAADALGYPESYYTPASQAIQRIKVIRGASSLQYGPQFGGLINFELKKEASQAGWEPEFAQTLGSFGFLNSYLSIGHSSKKWGGYAYVQRSQGSGWRENSGFESTHAHIGIGRKFEDQKIRLELTHMNYLAQQAGGLTDLQFQINPAQSFRERNWFRVNWNLAAIHYQIKLNSQHRIQARLFGLLASRESLGFLGPISRIDPEGNRSLISGHFRNLGAEVKHRVDVRDGKRSRVHVSGVRVYRGNSEGAQGLGSEGFGPDFKFIQDGGPNQSNYAYPSYNLAAFHEALIELNSNWNLTLGARGEHLHTTADGWYRQTTTDLAGDTIFDERYNESIQRSRSFLLGGFGLSFKPRPNRELYLNLARNYRGITFNDLRVVNPNIRIDPNMEDEKGWTGDLGWRHTGEWLQVDASGFALVYANRIGLIQQVDSSTGRLYQFRSNIASARSLGLEGLIQIKLDELSGWENLELKPFLNFGLTKAQYISSDFSGIEGNRVEMVPSYTLRMGIESKYNNLGVQFVGNLVGQQFTDASNALFTADAVIGEIPSYQVFDLNFSYDYKAISLGAGVSNLFNQSYFTRRATAYPGPGIIPAQPRTFHLELKIRLNSDLSH